MKISVGKLGIIDIEANGYALGLIPGCVISDEITRRPNMNLTQVDIDAINSLATQEWTSAVIAQHIHISSAPTQAEQFSAIERAFDNHIDNVAASRGYGRNGVSPVAPSEACKGFAGYPNPWQTEAIKFGQWSADCCARMIQGQQDVMAGTRAMPTPEQAIAELPAMVW